MGNLGVIAGNAFREVLHERIIYSVFIITLVLATLVSSPLTLLNMAREAGDSEIVAQLSAKLMTIVLGVWSYAATVLGAILGAALVPNELKSKTIVTVLSRPVSRGEFLLGKWLGVVAFVLLYLLVGVIAACGLAAYFAIGLTPLFWLAVAAMAINCVLVSGTSVVLGAFFPKGVASIVALILPAVGSIAESFRDGSFGLVADVVYHVAPAVMPVSLLDASFTTQMLDPQYALYGAVLAENLLYAGAVLLIGTQLFSRTEIHLG